MKRGTRTNIARSLKQARTLYKKFSRIGHYRKAVLLKKHIAAHAALLREVSNA